MNTIESKINLLKLKHEKEIKALEMSENATKLTEFDCIGYSDLSIGFYAYNEYIYKNGVKTLADVQKIMDVYKPSQVDNYVLTFAGKENIVTESPFCLKLWSNENVKPSAKLHYTDANGVKIQIELPTDLSIFNTSLATGKHIGFGRYETYRVISLKNATEFTLTNYVGGHKYYTGKAESFIKLIQTV